MTEPTVRVFEALCRNCPHRLGVVHEPGEWTEWSHIRDEDVRAHFCDSPDPYAVEEILSAEEFARIHGPPLASVSSTPVDIVGMSATRHADIRSITIKGTADEWAKLMGSFRPELVSQVKHNFIPATTEQQNHYDFARMVYEAGL